MENIKNNIYSIKSEISKLEKKYHREPGSVELLAVSKTRTAAEVTAAYDAGQKHFGENYLQEALTKIETLKDTDIIWHFIGPIQSNKTRTIAENFTWAHSIDRLKIAQRLNDQRPTSLSPINICIEVNVSAEGSKSGINFSELPDLALAITKLPNLKLRGLMAIPEITDDFNLQQQNFHKVKTAFDNLNRQGFQLDTLSMGMSGDYEAAIAEGATIVRIGTAIFGLRNYIKK